MGKTIEQNFVDWEGAVFGFGYGSGEPHTITALKAFLDACPSAGTYDYEALERTLTPAVTWLLINILARAGMIEYGTSPRFGWLTDKGVALKAFMTTYDVDGLVALVTERTEDDVVCYPDACNCGPEGYEKGRKCANPFWSSK